MLKNLPIMLLSIAQKLAHYAQNYAHKIKLCSWQYDVNFCMPHTVAIYMYENLMV